MGVVLHLLMLCRWGRHRVKLVSQHVHRASHTTAVEKTNVLLHRLVVDMTGPLVASICAYVVSIPDAASGNRAVGPIKSCCYNSNQSRMLLSLVLLFCGSHKFRHFVFTEFNVFDQIMGQSLWVGATLLQNFGFLPFAWLSFEKSSACLCFIFDWGFFSCVVQSGGSLVKNGDCVVVKPLRAIAISQSSMLAVN